MPPAVFIGLERKPPQIAQADCRSDCCINKPLSALPDFAHKTAPSYSYKLGYLSRIIGLF